MEAIVAKAQNQLERVALVALGWILTLVGILGLFLPIVPGAFLIVAGALMLSPRSVWLQRAEKCRARFPSWIAPLRGSPLGRQLGRAVSGTIRMILDRDRQFESLGLPVESFT